MAKREEAIVEEIEGVSPENFDSSILHLRRNLQEVLGDQVHIHFAASPQIAPARLSMLMSQKPRYTPVRWSALDKQQRAKIENFIPYFGTDDFVRYGDTIVVTCPQAEWEAELKRKARVAQNADSVHRVAADFTKSTGIKSDTRWEDIRGGAPGKEGVDNDDE